MATLDMFYTFERLISLTALSLTSPNILIFIAIPRSYSETLLLRS
jgi:hypothetical protein